MKKTIVFLGRNTEGIIEDARRQLGEIGEIIVISRDGDTLEPPKGLTVITVSNYYPEAGFTYQVVANGGTSTQLVPTIRKIVESGYRMAVYDIQRDGCIRLW
jgi:hypothetical protein